MTTPTNENARPLGRADRAQRPRVSKIHPQILPHMRPWGISSAGLPFPHPATCAGQLLAYLLTKGTTTPRLFDQAARTMRTPVYVARLRKAGWPIVTTMNNGENKYEKVRFASYHLEGVEVGEAEESFVVAAQWAQEGIL